MSPDNIRKRLQVRVNKIYVTILGFGAFRLAKVLYEYGHLHTNKLAKYTTTASEICLLL